MRVWLLASALLLVALPALAGDDLLQQAKEHFRLGRALYDGGRFDEAAVEFRRGYDARPEPLFLYNIAQSERRAGHVGPAIDHYRRYLQAKPDAAERAEVQAFLVELERQKESEKPVPAKSRRGLWIGLGVGAAALVVGGVTAGLVLGLPRSIPATDLGNHVFVGQ